MFVVPILLTNKVPKEVVTVAERFCKIAKFTVVVDVKVAFEA
jgi:hypothetical protein